MNKKFKTILQYFFFFSLGAFLVWWSVKDITAENRSQIKTALKGARHWLLIPVFVILVLSHYLRAIRWKLLMQPLGYSPRTTNTVFAVFIGYLANQAVPRLGEVLKCTILARYEKVPADKLVGTIVLERLVDAMTLLVVFGITLLIQPDIYSQLIDAIFHTRVEGDAAKSPAISSSMVMMGIGVIIMIALIIWMVKNKKGVRDLGLLVKKIGRSVWQGISAIRKLERRWLFIFYTVSMWILYLLGGFLGFMAFDETEQYGISEAFTVLSAGSIGMIATPGGIGAYAYLIQKTMEVYGLNQALALAFGWILWLAQTVVILIGGLISFIAIPYYNKNLLSEAARTDTGKDTYTA